VVEHSKIDVARRGRILVVDDDRAVARVIVRALRQHEVIPVESAGDALTLIRSGAHFDVILCDLMMPVMTGMDFHKELSDIAPRQAEAVVFMTGGAFTTRAREFFDDVTNLRLEKPFDVAKLCATVHALLK
jgi:CheY-like chemotaxis protein